MLSKSCLNPFTFRYKISKDLLYCSAYSKSLFVIDKLITRLKPHIHKTKNDTSKIKFKIVIIRGSTSK